MKIFQYLAPKPEDNALAEYHDYLKRIKRRNNEFMGEKAIVFSDAEIVYDCYNEIKPGITYRFLEGERDLKFSFENSIKKYLQLIDFSTAQVMILQLARGSMLHKIRYKRAKNWILAKGTIYDPLHRVVMIAGDHRLINGNKTYAIETLKDSILMVSM